MSFFYFFILNNLSKIFYISSSDPLYPLMCCAVAFEIFLLTFFPFWIDFEHHLLFGLILVPKKNNLHPIISNNSWFLTLDLIFKIIILMIVVVVVDSHIVYLVVVHTYSFFFKNVLLLYIFLCLDQ